ncbi:MAG: VCBS repeat-containing protein [Planctomycetota bacterium]|nr:MAG: VCBS repeat-containing protein [Planctomycetota bacterium]
MLLTVPLFLAALPQGTTVSFLPRTDWPLAGSQPQDLALVDLDRDGDLDLVVPSSADPEPTIKWNNGAGAFPNEESIPSSFPSWGVGTGDFNADGWPDLVFGDGWNQGTSIEVWYGNPADPARPILGQVLAGGRFPIAFRSGDLDGDGDPDLVCANNVLYGLTVFRNQGGLFGAAEHLPNATGLKARHLELADLDDDGDLDIVLTAYGLFTFLNDGTGHFPQRNWLGGGHAALAVADFDQDGAEDFVAADLYSSQAVLSFGDGLGGVRSAVTLSFPDDVTALHAADLNVDGIPDLVSVHSYLAQARVRTGHGDGTFHPEQIFHLASQPQTAAAGDLDGNGRPDLVVPDRNLGRPAPVSVLLNATAFEPWTHLGLGKRGPAGLPLLRGAGPGTAGARVQLQFSGGPPTGLAVLVAGTARIDLPYLGGTVVPRPDHRFDNLPLDPQGGLVFPLTLPPSAPPGARGWFQVWVASGEAASNGLRITLG